VLSGPVGGRNSRWRWLPAAVATLLVVAMVGGAFFVFGARSATPSLVAQYVPAGVPAFAELRYDMPGDQHDKLATFMSHFPGFADTAAFDEKLDETLNNVLQRSKAGLDWYTDVEPWFGGQIGVFTASLAPTTGTPPSATFVFSVKDRAALQSVVDAHSAGFTQEDYKGTTLWSGTAPGSDKQLTYAVTDDAFVVGTRNEDVKAALDAKSGVSQGLSDDSFFTSQLSALHSDRLALFYLDGSSFEQMMGPLSSFEPSNDLPAGCSGLSAGMMTGAASKVMGEIRAENDHLAFNVRSQYSTGDNRPPAPANVATTLTQSMPSSTVAYAEIRGAGAQIGYLVGQIMKCMPSGEAGTPDLSQLSQLLGVAPEDYFDFLQDAGVAVTLNGDKFGVGVVATVDDENVARTRVERLLAFVRLAGGSASDITVEEEQHGDATITKITLGSAGFVPGQDGPPDPVTLRLTVSGGRLYLGLDDFVTTALDQQASDSLASNPQLTAALNEVGTSNSGMFFVNVPQVLSWFEAQSLNEGSQVGDDQKQFLDPLGPFVVVTKNDNGINDGHGFLYVE